MSDGPRISLTLSGLSRLYGDDLHGLLETARMADELGLHQITVTDHVVMGARSDRYPYGRFPFDEHEPWPEPLTTLAAIAAVTSRTRLATGVLIAPLRPPVLLAKTLATLDVLSRGRLDLGVGTGWQREEYDAAGLPFTGRFDRMLDGLRACRVLWRDAPASFASATVSFENVWCRPRPVQPGGVPFWFGTALRGPRAISAIAELGAGWMPIVADPGELWRGIETLREAFRAGGRDPASLGVRATPPVVRGADGRPDLEATLAVLPEWHARGVTVASFALAAFASRARDVRPFLEALARAGLG